MFRSIRWRLVASYVLFTLLAVSLVGVLALEMVSRYIQEQEVNDLQANAETVAQQAISIMWPVLRQDELSQLARTASFLGDMRVRIVDKHGRVLTDTEHPSGPNRVIWISPSQAGEIAISINGFPDPLRIPANLALTIPGFEISDLDGELPPGFQWFRIQRSYGSWGSRIAFEALPHDEDVNAENMRPERTDVQRSQTMVTVPIGEDDSPLGFVELSAGPIFGAEGLAAMRQALLLAGGGTILLAGLLGLWVSHKLASPLHKLSETAEQMGTGDLSVRASVRSKDEIGVLAAQFNNMAERLETNFKQLSSERDSLRRFISDASHELRTPITALKNFNMLLLGPAKKDVEAQTEFLTESKAQIERLEWITENLLDLSRMDAGILDLDYANHDIGEVIEASVAPFKSIATDQGVSLFVITPDSQTLLLCDRARLEIAITNLLDNALKFTSSGGEVSIGGEKMDDKVRIRVSDNGTGIHPDDLPHIFERFYRGQGQAGSGRGLGLSIVKSTIEAQGGHVTVESSPGEGSRFTLEWRQK